MPGPGSIALWAKRAGEWVRPGEPVGLVTVGQQLLPLLAPTGGVLTAVLRPAGGTASAGEHLAYIDPALAGLEGQRLLPWSELRQRIGQHVQYSSIAAAHVDAGVEVDMSRLQSQRRALKERGLDLSLTPFFVRAAAEALLDWPALNGQVTPYGLLLPERVDVSVPVAIPGGVHLAVLRAAPFKPVSHLAAELALISAQLRAGNWSPELSMGGTFTVTNPGSLGSVWGTAVINQPNCAILACQAVVERPTVAPGGRVEVRPMMNMTLSFDHRALDGVMTMGFLERVKEILEAAQLPV